MDTSDDALFGGGDVDTGLPARTAQNVTQTAERVDEGSEAARRTRARRRSLVTRDFEPPQLSRAALLGV